MIKIIRFRIIAVFIFILIIIIGDFSFGHILGYLYFHSKSGRYNKLIYVIKKSKEDILIFGSSHAECHYVPSIIKDSLQLECYNAGFRNQGILFTYAIHKSILRRYSPKLIIINVENGLFCKNELDFETEEAKLSELLPFCKKEPELKAEIENKSNYEKYKLYSNIYPYNSSFVYLIKYFASNKDNFIDGYYPLYGKYDLPTIDNENKLAKNSNKEYINKVLIQKFIQLIIDFQSQKTKIIAVISPSFQNHAKLDSSIEEILQQQSIPLLDYSYDQHFIDNASYFTDGHHLNDSGARLFSSIVAHDVKFILKK